MGADEWWSSSTCKQDVHFPNNNRLLSFRFQYPVYDISCFVGSDNPVTIKINNTAEYGIVWFSIDHLQGALKK